MRRIIHHYDVAAHNQNRDLGEVPPGSLILSAKARGDKIVLYLAKPTVKRQVLKPATLEAFYVETGENYDDGLGFNFVGTVDIERDGAVFMAHVFARVVT